MKKIFVIFVCILTTVAFLSAAWAIDRSPKDSSSDKKEKPIEVKKIKEKKSREEKQRTGTYSEKIIRRGEDLEKVAPEKAEKTEGLSERKKSQEKYDYFIDRNNNGIDDRLEKDIKAKEGRERQEVIEKKTPASSEKAPAKVSPSTTAPKKVKETKVEEQKQETKVKKAEKKNRSDKR